MKKITKKLEEKIYKNNGIYDTAKYRYLLVQTSHGDEIYRTLIRDLGTTEQYNREKVTVED